MYYHDQLLRRSVISGTIITVSPLLIGSGDKGEGSKRDILPLTTVYKGKNVPYIPGSSLKGVFKNAINRVLVDKGVETCYLQRQDRTCGNRQRKRLSSAIRRRDSANLLREIVSGFCLSCKLFGTMGFKGLVNFSDCLPVDGEKYTFNTRYGVAIDRLSGSVSPGANFQLKYVERGSQFDFHVLFRNLPLELVALFFLAIFDFNRHVITLGGFKSKGFGQVRFQLENFDIKDLLGTPGVDDRIKAEHPPKSDDLKSWSRQLVNYYAKRANNFDYAGYKRVVAR